MEKDLKDYRQSYEKDKLIKADLPENPLELFGAWFKIAENHPEIREVNAMSLATVGRDGFPKTRVVLLKSFSLNGFKFYTNYNSEKSGSILLNPKVCLSFFWPELEKQVIIKGEAKKTSAEDSEAYFKVRPRESQLGAWASEQSSEIPSREVLEARMENLEIQFKDKPIPRPPHWGGFEVKAMSFEFWQGRRSRLHDRFIYKLESTNWKIERLAP